MATWETCKSCKYQHMCSITKGDDWFCADWKPLLNIVEDNKSWIDELMRRPVKLDFEMMPPKPCRTCPNHPNNGGSGMCNCILGNYPIT